MSGSFSPKFEFFTDETILAATGLASIPDNLEVGVKFGRSMLLTPMNTPADVWNGGGLYTGQSIVGGVPVEVFSSDVGDNADIEIFGLDALGNEQSEPLTLNGTTPVASGLTWNRVFRGVITSTPINTGSVTCWDSSNNANVFFVMPPGSGQTVVGALTVPANKNMAIFAYEYTSIRANGSAYSCEVTLRIREPGGVYRAIRTYGMGSGFEIRKAPRPPIVLPPLTDIVARIEDVSDNDVSVSFEMSYFLYNV